MGDITMLLGGVSSIDRAVDMLLPETRYRQERLRECIGLVYSTNSPSYSDDIFDLCKEIIEQETHCVVSKYVCLLNTIRADSEKSIVKFYVASIGFITSCLTSLENFSSVLMRTNVWVDYLTSDEEDVIISGYSQRAQFLDWLASFYEDYLSQNPILTRKVMEFVSGELGKRSSGCIELDELKTMIKRSCSFFGNCISS